MAIDPNFAVYVDRRQTHVPLLSGVSGYPIEDHKFNLSVTHYPVESGSKLTDNAVREQTMVVLEGRVADIIPGFTPGEPQRVWGRIFSLIDSRTPVIVITRLRTYPNMIITKCNAPVSRETGKSLQFRIEFTEILFATAQIVRFPPETVSPSGPAAHRTSEVDGGDRSSPYLSPSEFRAYQGLPEPRTTTRRGGPEEGF